MSESTTTLCGNLTREPELRFTAAGQAVTNFGIAVNRRFQVNGEWQEKTSFFNCVAWGLQGENLAASLSKGMRVVVTGRIESRDWQTDQGEKRTTVEVIVEEAGPSLRWAKADVTKVTTAHEAAPAPAEAAAPAEAPAKANGKVKAAA